MKKEKDFSLDELQKELDSYMMEYNQKGLPEFEGYSPLEMTKIFYNPFGEVNLVRLKKMKPEEYAQIPLLNQVLFLAQRLKEKGEMKLTAKGSLPVDFVSEIYKQGFIKDRYIETGLKKLYKEMDSMAIHLPRVVMDGGLTRKRNNKWRLTKQGERLVNDLPALLDWLVQACFRRLNWAYFDGFGEHGIGQMGIGFTLMLLEKYGQEKRPSTFYAEKYFNAYPAFLDQIDKPVYGTVEGVAFRCYSYRTFHVYLRYFGLVELEEGKGYREEDHVMVTPLFGRMIEVIGPQQG